MSPAPVCVAMIVCDDIVADQDTGKYHAIGILHGLSPKNFPHRRNLLNVLVVLTDAEGSAHGQIVCVDASTDRPVFGSAEHEIVFPNRLAVTKVAFELKNCMFPHPGQYAVQCWCDGQVIAECRIDLLLKE